MKSIFTSVVIVAALGIAPAVAQQVKLDNDESKYGYAQGYVIGQRVKKSLIKDKIDLKSFVAGVTDALIGKAKMDQKQMISEIRKGPVAERAALEKKKMDNEKYLAENKTKEGVVTTASGLQYKIIKSGPQGGKNPTASDTVVVHYTGTLTNGKKFDSSVDRGKPASFGVGQVIPGWTEVLKLMKPGDKWAVVIPSKLGYGERGAGASIGPNEILLFDVELISIK
jgi:FKBP-type peptidyl-prolyl cis-trans isomerase FklB